MLFCWDYLLVMMKVSSIGNILKYVCVKWFCHGYVRDSLTVQGGQEM